MSALGHIILGWLVGMLTSYLLEPSAGFFVAILVGFFIGVATAVAALFTDYKHALRRANHADHS